MRIVAAVLFACVGCVSGDAHECAGDDGVTLLCPASTKCRTVGGAAVCATPDQIASCAGASEGATCTGGVCHAEICLPVVCGDGRVDPPELCDTALAAPCSPDCTSDLRCGNGIVEPALGEQCDDGNVDAHDGCDSRCRPEIPRWTELSTGKPPARVDTAMAYDTVRGEVVMFGGNTGVTNTNGITPDFGDTWLWVNNAWRRVQPLASPAARSHHAMAYDGDTRRVYLFGGETTSGTPLGDLWAWDGVSWHHLPPNAADQNPPPTTGAAMAYDAHRKRLVLVGGRRTMGTTTTLTTDTFEFDGVHWSRGPQLGVPGRAGHMVAYDPIHANVVLFGGAMKTGMAGQLSQLDDTQVYDGTSWKVPPGALNQPSPRERGQLGFDGTKIVLTGGVKDTDITTSDTTTYGWDGVQWRALPTSGPALFGAGIAFVPDGLVMFGGREYLPGTGGLVPLLVVSDRTHVWDATSVWTLTTQTPLAVARGASALDLDRARPVMIGGVGDHQLYELSDGVWTDPYLTSSKILTPFQPPGRRRSAGAYDEARGAFVLFGGDPEPTTASRDAMTYTWAFQAGGPQLGNLPAWTVAAATGPAARSGHAMAYDASRKLTVLFGGVTTAGASDETWLWDGAAWTLLAAGSRPGPRDGHALAYDRTHQQIVMFGGRLGSNLPSSETWLLDASGWRAVAMPPDATPWPSARFGAAMAWDPARRRVVMVGGQSGILEQDTWEWDGRTWTQVPVFPPSPRTGGILVGTSDGLVLTGGLPSYDFGDAAAFSDVWLLRYEAAEPGSSCRDGGDDDGDGLAGCDDPDCWLACHPACLPGDACAAALPHCGDGLCHGIETAELCPADSCTSQGSCGDGQCDATDATKCAGDCP